MGVGYKLSMSSDSYQGMAPSTNSYQPPPAPPPVVLPNPNPSKYRIIREKIVKEFLIIEILYEGCTNYEGRKILVYKDITYQQLIEQKLIDPHFSEGNEYISPIARFEPTERGWEWAINFAS